MYRRPFTWYSLLIMLLLCAEPLSAGGQGEASTPEPPDSPVAETGEPPLIPEILPLDSDGTTLSPNGDGRNESVAIRFEVSLGASGEPPEKLQYGISIADAEERELFRRSFSRLPSPGESLIREIQWAGTATDGTPLPDGPYRLRYLVAANGEILSSLPGKTLSIDTTPPTLSFETPEQLLFSPNGDGMDEILKIGQNGEAADWTGYLFDRNRDVVREYRWVDSAPPEIILDGTDAGGQALPEGRYFYRVSGVDAAGNRSEEFVLEGIEIDRSLPELQVTINHDAFSPNGDGHQDSVLAIPRFTYRERVTGWTGVVEGVDSDYRLEFHGRKGEPFPFTFTGTDESGNPLPEGSYHIRYTVGYRNGIVLEQKVACLIDTTFPEAEINYEEKFTPNMDFNNDQEDMTMRSDEPISWRGEIVDDRGTALKVFELVGTSGAVTWDGSDQSGRQVPDGTYFLSGRYQDPAGNGADLDPPYAIIVDSRPVGIEMHIPAGFSPNDDGLNDMLPVGLVHEVANVLTDWRIDFFNEGGTKVRTYTGEAPLPDTLFWDGSLEFDRNRTAPDGRYTARLHLEYEKRPPVEFGSRPFLLDTEPPRIRLDVSEGAFDRGTTRIFGTVPITIAAEDESGLDYWILDILDREGEIVRSYEGAGDPSEHIWWNGRNEADEPIDEGDDYTFRVTVIDGLGNRGVNEQERRVEVVVIWKDGKYYLLIPNIIFGAYRHELDSAGEAMHKRNLESLEKVVAAFEEFPEHRLILEGHALNVLLDGPREEEEEQVLQPLTERRAATVMRALIDLGFDPDRISAEAFGGQFPLAPVDDLRVRWKNRRVEFVMVEEEE